MHTPAVMRCLPAWHCLPHVHLRILSLCLAGDGCTDTERAAQNMEWLVADMVAGNIVFGKAELADAANDVMRLIDPERCAACAALAQKGAALRARRERFRGRRRACSRCLSHS